mmetsp:Transcript_15199/g.51321  ORF Transcript_15199/g.51321 Transcript_15199/m.51321 type:complete len:267 (+) Transcript_15199:609-1409(+)
MHMPQVAAKGGKGGGAGLGGDGGGAGSKQVLHTCCSGSGNPPCVISERMPFISERSSCLSEPLRAERPWTTVLAIHSVVSQSGLTRRGSSFCMHSSMVSVQEKPESEMSSLCSGPESIADVAEPTPRVVLHLEAVMLDMVFTRRRLKPQARSSMVNRVLVTVPSNVLQTSCILMSESVSASCVSRARRREVLAWMPAGHGSHPRAGVPSGTSGVALNCPPPGSLSWMSPSPSRASTVRIRKGTSSQRPPVRRRQLALQKARRARDG